MTKLSASSIEKSLLKRAVNHLKNWSSYEYFSGGATTADNSSRADEDLTIAKSLNTSTKLIPARKLNNIIKQVKSQSNGQAMYADPDTLSKISKSIKKLA